MFSWCVLSVRMQCSAEENSRRFQFARCSRRHFVTTKRYTLVVPSSSCNQPCSPRYNRQKDNKQSSAGELKLRLTGATKTAAKYMDNNGHDSNNRENTAHETYEFLSYDVQLADFGGKAASGMHNLPFSVMIPAGSPPSMQVIPYTTPRSPSSETGLFLLQELK